ncbi:alkaline-phosphatase-like protein [Rhodotorula diobovata]|uniref:GPI ethanolamine phosphate transferase 2 n=1 Tax=Rhodotorula diobovata TaxID=5288 RepID=A0A5C5FP77_9BASI|nr:alkaline-phosphatase-like protein [Rhodotorula diobovata]
MEEALSRKSSGQLPLLRLSFLVIAAAGLASFALGFFPVKPLLPGYSSAQSYVERVDRSDDRGEARSDAFSRLVFVVVDALRSDLAFGPDSHMSFVASLIDGGHALPYTAIAQAPTVTLPRLKALTTGSNPTFVDALLNLAEETTGSAAFDNVDSWLPQLVVPGGGATAPKKAVFAGDDTWLRLFPKEWFVWHEGVSSFFVSDTVTVDSNVTRHLDALLAPPSLHTSAPAAPPTSWDVLILHYLGLDHVGHLEGPASPRMAPKQVEMDEVVERIYRYLENRDAEDGQRSLLVVVGDHGMTEGGNHGGSTEAETSAALLLAAPTLHLNDQKRRVVHVSPYKHYEVVQQIDLVPTLSVLFDLGIPRNSIGKLVRSAVEALRPAALARGLRENVQQVGAVLTASGSGAVERTLAESAGDESRPSSLGELVREGSLVQLAEFLARAQARLLASSSSYHLRPLFCGLALLLLASLASLYRLRRVWTVESRGSRFAVGAAVVAFVGSFFATSFIEEEHEFWYFVTATALLLLASGRDADGTDRVALVASAASVRLMRSWAHNGQKNLPNLSITAHLATSPRLTSALVALTYFLPPSIAFVILARASRAIARQRLPPGTLLRKASLFAVTATVVVAQSVVGVAAHLSALEDGAERGVLLRALDKLELAEHGALARAGYALAAVGWLLWRVWLRRQVSTALPLVHLSLLLMSLTRPVNVPLFVAFWTQHWTLARMAHKPSASPAVLASLVAALQSTAFFALGGSNSLATADLSQAYNGLASYSLPLVTLLAFLSNFSGPVFLALSLRTLPRALLPFILDYLSAFHTLALAMLALSATHFREHLFALTVFAPAVLYRAGWFVWVQVGTNLGIARMLMG